MVIGQGSTTETLGADSIQNLLAHALEPIGLDGKRVLIIIPDGTRTTPIPLLFRLLYEQIGRRVARLDYLIALGTHPPMPEDAIAQLVGAGTDERGRTTRASRSSITAGINPRRSRRLAQSAAERPNC